MYEGIVQDLIDELGRLPGVGPKSAQRIAFHIVQTKSFDVTRLANTLLEVRERVRFCIVCGNIAEAEECAVCRDPRRDRTVICVVEEPKDVAAIERTREFGGLYHVLGGAISPIDGIGPDDLNIRPLLQRLESGEVQEVIIATDPNLEGDATASYLSRLMGAMDIQVSRLASGLPVGGDLEYADEVTLGRAFSGRRALARRTPPPGMAGAGGGMAGHRADDGAQALPSGPRTDEPAEPPKRPADPRDERGPRISLGGRPSAPRIDAPAQRPSSGQASGPASSGAPRPFGLPVIGNAGRETPGIPTVGNAGRPQAAPGSGWSGAPAGDGETYRPGQPLAPRPAQRPEQTAPERIGAGVQPRATDPRATDPRATEPQTPPDAWADER
ncbi:Recombination protein RecR [Pseudoclavibacter triregionum]|nr:Recombination protein RecR [Pseudoclavibacter triregionum]